MAKSAAAGRTVWHLPDRRGSRPPTGVSRQVPFLTADDLDRHRQDCQICNGVSSQATNGQPVTEPPEPTSWFAAPTKSSTPLWARPGRAPVAAGVVVLVALGAGLILGFGVFDQGTPTARVRTTPVHAAANIPVATTTPAPPPTAPPAPPETTTTSSTTTTTTTTTTVRPTTTTPRPSPVLTPSHVIPHASTSSPYGSTYRGGYTTTTAPSYHPYYAPSTTTTTRARGR